MTTEQKPTVHMGWRYDRGPSRPCVVEVHSIKTGDRQFSKQAGTGNLYGPFPNRESASKFVTEYGLGKQASISIRHMCTMNECIEAFSLVRGKSTRVEKVEQSPQPKQEPVYGPYTLRARAKVR